MFGKIINFILIFLVLFSVASCSYKPQVGPPWAQKLLKGAPEGPTEFKLGWKDGCQTGISVTANAFQRHFYTFVQNEELANKPDRVYYKAWKTAYTYCHRYVFQYLRRSML